MPLFKKKPVVIEAHQFFGSSSEVESFRLWIAGHVFRRPVIRTGDLQQLQIETLEGVMSANPGDWIIKGVSGEFYPCKPDIFAATYEEVSNERQT